jgi:FKBP-type peptidyl-prolyl cis-trans isomerase SlyD
MIIGESKVVSFHYTLKNSEGEQLETSREREAMSYLHGSRNIIPGLEKAMEGRAVGDAFSVTVDPEEAYGTRTEANIQRIPIKRQILSLQTNQGQVQVTVVKVGKFNLDVDANHPLSGQALTFDVEIMAVRDATEEEKSHGHAHGPGGHNHG